jgi:hypothetical protein
MLGHTSLFNSSDNNGGLLGTLEGSIENIIQGAVNDITVDIARAVNLHDFYTAHILDFCEGYYKPNASDTHASKNVTNCSNHTALFHFNPQEIIQHELKSGVSLSDIKWPNQIEDAVKALEVAGKTMFVCYCIGIALAGLAVIGAFVGLLLSGRLSALLNFVLCIVCSPLLSPR